MTALTRLAIGHPRPAIVAWIVATLCLGALGSGVVGPGLEQRLVDTALVLPGTESQRAVRMYREEFGESVAIPVLLRGPAEQLDRQGPRLVASLRERDDMRILSPWDEGNGTEQLRPEPGAALVVSVVDVLVRQNLETAGHRVRDIVDEEVSEPVQPHLSGLPIVGAALNEETFKQARRAERIAIPVLLVVLLLVFRSPVAAAVPLLFGVATVAAGSGILTLLAMPFDINVIAMSLASMMGLALGVDYSLLIVARFREELARGSPPVAAALGVIVVAAWSVVASFVATPAILSLLGPNVDRWRIGPAAAGGGWWATVAGGVMRRPLLAALPVLAILLLVASPAAGLDSGAPDVRQLPESSQARKDFRQLEETMGPGWAAPFEVVAVAGEEPITTESRLREIERWQRRVARDPGVRSVVGPGAVRDQASELRDAGERVDEAPEEIGEARESLEELEGGLARARDGAGELSAGLEEAARLAGAMSGGAGLAAGEAERFAAGMERAERGAGELAAGIGEARSATRALAEGAAAAASGASRLRDGVADARRQVEASVPQAEQLAEGLERGASDIGRLREPARIAQEEVEAAARALRQMTVGKVDPRYARALASVLRAQGALTGRDPTTGAAIDPDYPGLVAALGEAEAGVRRAAGGAREVIEGSRRLAAGLREIERGARELRSGIARVADGNTSLAQGLGDLQDGAAELEEGLGMFGGGADDFELGMGRLSRGLDELGSGLAEGSRESETLTGGLGEMRGAVASFTDEAGLDEAEDEIREFRRRVPRMFDSGYFVLAALDGAREADRRRARFAINLDGGGQAGLIMVVPEAGPNDPGTEELRDRLSSMSAELADAAGVETAVGGQGAILVEFGQVTQDRLPLLIVTLSIVTFLVLVPIFRAIMLPAIGILLNLLTVAAAFGVLSLLFVGSDPPLGGPGYIDAVAVTAIFAVIFALSIDYQVFLIARMREHYPGSGAGKEAIRTGIQKTAAVVTGAALIMAGVFIAFATTEIASLRQFGIGLSVAVLLDATVVRLVLLPAAMRLGGRWTWWLPAWLDRRLPRLHAE